MIGNRVYANRMGNGDEASGDGYKYRGRGYIQVTGKSHYTAYGQYAGIDAVGNPDQLTLPPHDLLSAAWYFESNGLWTKCDAGVDLNTVKIITKAVNGGYNGLNE